jgi:hypothetical protein
MLIFIIYIKKILIIKYKFYLQVKSKLKPSYSNLYFFLETIDFIKF